MPRLSLHAGLCALALLALPACDSGVSSGTDALVGSWAPKSTSRETHVTVRSNQTYIDRFGATIGTVRFEGTDEGVFRFVISNRETPPVLTTYELGAFTPPVGPGRYQLVFETGPRLRLTGRRANGDPVDYTAAPATPAYTYTDGAVTVRPVILGSTGGGGASVSVAGGTMTFRQFPLVAGQRTLLNTVEQEVTDPLYGFPGTVPEVRYTFEDDGAFRVERTYPPNETQTIRGTWTAAAGELRLTIVRDGIDVTRAFLYSTAGGRLRLSAPVDLCASEGAGANCLQGFEQQLGVQSGTLAAAFDEPVYVFAPAAGR